MQQEAKLVTADQLNGHKHQFLIFKNQIVGKGGFGVVHKAIRNDRPNQLLVAKIIPYDSESKRVKIEKEIDILRKLEPHENLVIVEPFKCYSANNYYIFMEYCQEGTLEDLIKIKKGNFSENQIFDIFYQLMNGYEVLWNNKILHQDLKPENVLIKNGKFKLTDFGFSILHQGYKYGNIREGTLPYMPLQKLTQKQYYASTKSDVYSLGIILFRLITGYHPYVNSKGKQHRQYLRQLKLNPLHLRPHFSSRFSLKFQHFFDIVLKMISKDEASRIDFDKIFSYMQQEKIFDELRQKNLTNKEQHVQNQLNKYTIVGESGAIAIPFKVPSHQQQKYRQQLEQKTLSKQQQQQQYQINQIQNFIISQRIIVYFFDRMARRIYVQKLKLLNKSKIEQVLTQKVLLSTLLICKKIIQGLLKQCKIGGLFPINIWKIYRKRDQNLIKMIERDQNQLQDLIIDCLSQSSQTKILQRKAILDKSKGDFGQFRNFLDQNLTQLLRQKIALIKPQDKNALITICYLLSGIDILRFFSKWEKQALQLELYFRKVQTEDCEILFSRVLQELQEKQITFSLDLGEFDG